MAGVHRLEHVKSFRTTNLTDDDPIRPHPQSIADKFALRDMANAFDVGWPGLHLHDMRLLQAKLYGIFNGDNSLGGIDMAGDRIQQGSLARARAARDQNIDPAACRNVQELRHFRGNVSLADHLFESNVL